MKKNIKVFTCMALGMVMAGMPLTAYASEDNETTKDETVYAMLHADGSVDEEIVSSWLHNDDGIKNIKETLALKNVKNIKGNEKPSVNDDTYTWNVKGNDVYYEGVSSKQLPVKVEITYKLDGKEISGKDLIGKSGKLEMRIKMSNTKTRTVNINGRTTNIHPLYAGAGVIDLSSDHFSNVKCENANIISDGNNQVVGFVSVPGLEDTLTTAGIQANALHVQDEYVIQCETKDFELGPVMIALTPEISVDKLKDLNSVEDLMNGLDELKKGSVQLNDGTGTLQSGVTTLKSGTNKLAQGTNELTSNVKTLQDGLSLAKAGTGAMADETKGVPMLASSVDKLNQNMQYLAAKLNDGYKTMQNIDMNALSSTLTKLNGFATQLSDLITGVNQIYTVSTQALSNTELGEYEKPLGDEAEVVQNTVCELASQNTDDPNLTLSCAYAKAVKSKVDGIAEGSTKLAQALSQVNTDELNQALSILNSDMDILNGLASQMKDAADGSSLLAQGTTELSNKVNGLSDNVKTLDDSMSKLANGSTKLYEGSIKLQDGANAADTGTQTLLEGAHKLHEATMTLKDRMASMNNGAAAGNSDIHLSMDDLTALLKIKDEIVKDANQEHTFAGAPENSDSKVKFVYKTEELKKAKTIK